MGAFVRLSLPSATGVLAVATIAGIAALYELHFRIYSLLALAPVLVVALIYLRGYAARPLELRARPPPRPAVAPPESPASAPDAGAGTSATETAPDPLAPPEPTDESEPFDDPVEEADRLETVAPPAGPGAD